MADVEYIDLKSLPAEGWLEPLPIGIPPLEVYADLATAREAAEWLRPARPSDTEYG